MPKAKATKVYNNFSGGMITEAGPIGFPENATSDELNCDIFLTGTDRLRYGNKRRRLGFSLEESSALSSTGIDPNEWADFAINTFEWDSVGGDGERNFLVIQIGNVLYFYDQSETVLSTAAKSFTIDLDDYLAPAATTTFANVAQMSSGNGFLFVSSPDIDPIVVEYLSATDALAIEEISILIRDFDGVEDNLDPDEEPATLTDLHNYNLKNQGWLSPGTTVSDPVTTYFSAKSKYPPNSKQWWQAKDSFDNFSADLMTKFAAGNTEAPKGHYLIDAFNQDRSNVSGVPNIPVVSISARPKAIAFFAGRVWYAGVNESPVNGSMYYSQILRSDASNAGDCFQANDPTSEDLSDLLATDGGVIPIPEIGEVLRLFPMQTSLLVLANNGVWSISGGVPGAGFKATDFSVSNISSVGIDAPLSVVNVEGAPIWWGKTGINTVGQNQVSDRFEVRNISKQTIQGFYEDIPALSRANAKGSYDPAQKRVFWLYTETAPADNQNRFRCNRVLVFDVFLGAFFPWEVGALAANPYYIASPFVRPSLSALTEEFSVLNGTDTVVDGANTVVANLAISNASQVFIEYLVFRESSTVNWTFGNFSNTSFKDWYNVDSAGVNYTSYMETGEEVAGDISRKKQAPYVTCLFKRTETAYTDETYTAFVNPSSCYMQVKWEWSDHTNSGRWTPKMQVYRFVKEYVPDSGTDFDSGFPVVITKNKIRGMGKALLIRFESETGKDFNLIGWSSSLSGNTEV